jgi:hypothetical protein
MTLAAGTSAAYWSMAVFSLNAALVSGETDEVPDCRFSWYAMTKNALTSGANAPML